VLELAYIKAMNSHKTSANKEPEKSPDIEPGSLAWEEAVWEDGAYRAALKLREERQKNSKSEPINSQRQYSILAIILIIVS
jgi:hypothetical protein